MGLLVFLPVAALALVGFNFLTRGTPVHRVSGSTRTAEPPSVESEEFPPNFELHTKVAFSHGNEATVLTCGNETYPSLWEDLQHAKRSITMQMYYCAPGVVADRCKAILVERARAGVKVLFLRDAFGAAKLAGAYEDELKAAGVEVAAFRPVKWWALDKAYTRAHIRVVVIDGSIGYTGGFGLDDKWLGDGLHEGQWRDTTVRFTGPSVAQLQATFASGWAEATGNLITGKAWFHEAESPSERDAGKEGMLSALLHAAPTVGSTAAERFMAMSIACSCRELFITNAYFVPDDEFCSFLEHAADRGVDVRILVTNEQNDVKSTVYGARSVYERLLRKKVRIFEYQPAMNHAKTIVADGLWCAVGTLNFDNRSMAFNDETMFLSLDREMAARLREVFMRDLEHSREVTLEQHLRRGIKSKVIEFVVRKLERVL